MGDKLAFVGYEKGASDIYIYDINKKDHYNLTKDIFSDSEPTWSPDGNSIAFISDRDNAVNTSINTAQDMISVDYNKNDVYIIDVETRSLKQVTSTSYDENYPVFSSTEEFLFYTADSSGTWNLFKYDIKKESTTVVTNLLTGIFQLSLNKFDDAMVFSGYSNRGWDVYRVNNPLDLKEVEVKPTNFALNKDFVEKEELVDLRKDKWRGSDSNQSDYSRHIFAMEYESFNKQNSQISQQTSNRDTPLKNDTGDYIPQAYKTQFSLDIAQGQYGYNLSLIHISEPTRRRGIS